MEIFKGGFIPEIFTFIFREQNFSKIKFTRRLNYFPISTWK